MPSDLSKYLAEHYLTADPKPAKKRKRKQQQPADAGGLIIADDAETGWGRNANGDDDDADVNVAGTSAEFRKAKKSAWKTVGGGAPVSASAPTATNNNNTDSSSAGADAILAAAAAESAAADAATDELPVMMSDGTHAGLQSAAAVTAQLRQRKKRERDAWERDHGAEAEAETVYRDATGRRVDVSMKRAELRRAAAEAADKERQKTDALRGEVQVAEARRRREELEDARVLGVARGADDEALNRDLKGQARWGDTMAQFVSKDTTTTGGARKSKGRPVYQGAWTPNRYGIRPGYRWDGVDRGNGYEAERFKAINRVERNKGLEYNWQMDE